MASPRTRRKPPSVGKNKLAGRASTKGSGNSTLLPAISHTPAPTPAEVPVPAETPNLAPAPAPAPSPPGKYTDEDLQKATKLALELFIRSQDHSQLQASITPRKQSFKARFPDLYYTNSHLDCYRFCQ